MARLTSVVPVLRAALALVWFAGGAGPLFLTPSAKDMALLVRLGLSSTCATTGSIGQDRLVIKMTRIANIDKAIDLQYLYSLGTRSNF